jgi:small-conductance mechanosensitive channel
MGCSGYYNTFQQMKEQLAHIAYCAIVLIIFACLTMHISKLAINGLVEKKMRADRHGNEVHGDKAITLAKIYLVVAGVCMSGALFMLFLIIALIRLAAIDYAGRH